MKDTPLIAKSFEFSVGIINLCKVLHYRNEYTLSQQLMHAGTSVGAKLRESSNAQSKAESIRKLYEAQKECAETGYWLDLLIETDYLRENECDDIKVRAGELTLLVRDIITSTQRESKTAATNHAEFKVDPEK
jgi:four helix bundle protein